MHTCIFFVFTNGWNKITKIGVFLCLPVIGRSEKKNEEKIIFYDFASSKIEENKFL